ncbi:MAG: hypothetical protein R6V04_08335, partial [bacterium]
RIASPQHCSPCMSMPKSTPGPIVDEDRQYVRPSPENEYVDAPVIGISGKPEADLSIDVSFHVCL